VGLQIRDVEKLQSHLSHHPPPQCGLCGRSANIKGVGRYEIVPSPSDADIVLELEITYPVFDRSFVYPKFRLEVRDPKTNVLLWTYTEVVNGALLAKNGRKNVADALAKLTDDLKKS